MRLRFFNKQIRILLFADALVSIAAAMLGPIYALFVEELGGKLLDASFTVAAFALAGIITTLLTGVWVDRLKNKKLLLAFGYCMMGLGFVLFSFANTVKLVLIIQFVIGIADALVAPAYDALFSYYINRKKAGKEWGAWEASGYFANFIGATTGGILVSALGFKPVFWIMAVICWASGLYILKLPHKIL